MMLTSLEGTSAIYSVISPTRTNDARQKRAFRCWMDLFVPSELETSGSKQKNPSSQPKNRSHRRAPRRTEAYSAFEAAYVLPQCALRPLYCARALLATTGAAENSELKAQPDPARGKTPWHSS